MYSIPVYSLRFAAHCRSRLRLTEGTAVADRDMQTAPRFWIRFAHHTARVAGRFGHQKEISLQ